MKQHMLLHFICLFYCLSLCDGKTIQNAQLKKLPIPLLSGINDVHAGLSEKGKTSKGHYLNELDSSVNSIISVPLDSANNDKDYPVSSVITEEEIDNGVFASSGELGEALRQVWESLGRKIKVIERRLKHVERQSSDIMNRLAIVDCSALSEGTPSGVYTLYLNFRGSHKVQAPCQQETEGGGWTVILRRVPHEAPEHATNFSRGLRDYKIGFGSPDGDFWIGLENIHLWTSYRNYQLRIELEDFNGDRAFAHYDKFYLEDEKHGYRLQVSGYRGNAGDSLTNNNQPDNFTAVGMMFSTHDDDRDTSHEINCASYWNIGGWWYNRCSWANLMGPYRLPGDADGIGINWHKWRNKQYIKAVSMMIRPARS